MKHDSVWTWAGVFEADEHGGPAFLAPITGKAFVDPDSVLRSVYENYLKDPVRIKEAPSLATADYAALPFAWSEVLYDPSLLAPVQRLFKDAETAGRHVLVFFDDDNAIPVDWPRNARVVRFSVSRSTKSLQETVPPLGVVDLQSEIGEHRCKPRSYVEKPSISFCGFAPPLRTPFSKRSITSLLRSIAYTFTASTHKRVADSQAPRAFAIVACLLSRSLDARFVIRSASAFNKVGVLQPGGSPLSAANQRAEFIENLLDADYALCVRGTANCSLRLYEAMSVGRIPVLLDTNCALPYEDQIDWDRLIVRVPERDRYRIGRIVAERHRELGEEGFLRMQTECREAFVRWMTPEAFFHWLHGQMMECSKTGLNSV